MNAPRRVILVRHAHAEWPAWTGRDFDRPLTPRGLAEAAATAQAIAGAGHAPGRWLVSPAVRTRQTAEALATVLRPPSSQVTHPPALYNASVEALEAALRAALAQASCVLLVAHNPGISELARLLGREPAAPAFAPGHWRAIDVPAGAP